MNNTEEYMSDYETLVDSTFPLRYEWYVNGNPVNEERYLSVKELPNGRALQKKLNAEENEEKKCTILNDALTSLDQDVLYDAKNWTNSLKRNQEAEYSIKKINGYGEEFEMLSGDAGPSYNSFEENRHKENPSLKFLRELTK